MFRVLVLLSIWIAISACGSRNPRAGEKASAFAVSEVAQASNTLKDAGVLAGPVLPLLDWDKLEPGVTIVGRTFPGKRGELLAWPGTHVKAYFYGTRISVELEDEDHENEFEVIIDGRRFGKLVTDPETRVYPLAADLERGVHEIVLWRRTETTYEPTEFIAFRDFGPDGHLLAAPPLSERRIEVIGDSTTVGYGIEGEPPCEGNKSNQNNYDAYASVAARLVGADLVTIAWSGIGVYRNYDEDGPSSETMPALYDYAIATDPGDLWDFSRFEPQVVVVALGTNDFSTRGDPGLPFIEAYVDFLRRVRSNYPDAVILCLIQRESIAASIHEIVEIAHDEGDASVRAFDIRVNRGGRACEGHGNIERNRFLGYKLAAELRRVMGW